MSEIIYKKLGETSFQAIERFRASDPKYADERLSFAGRLDPMAEGLMLILVGDENDRRDDFLGLDKEYVSEMVLGVSTDSFDVMGKIQKVSGNIEYSEDKVQELFSKYVGKQMQKFPPFSKRHVQGKALFVWASEGRLDEIEIPEHEIEIYSLNIESIETIRLCDVAREAQKRIAHVTGDFRQESIIKQWKVYEHDERQLPIIKYIISCGTGTYVRQFSEDIGSALGCGALTYSIVRTKIGDFVDSQFD